MLNTYEVYSRKNNSINGHDISVIRHFYDRNFTCAAGNIFTCKGHKPLNYDEQYASTVESFSHSKSIYRKKTAWHLLSNSKKEKKDVLDTRLQKHLEILKQDPEIQKWLGSERMKSP